MGLIRPYDRLAKYGPNRPHSGRKRARVGIVHSWANHNGPSLRPTPLRDPKWTSVLSGFCFAAMRKLSSGQLHRATPNGRPFCPVFVRLDRDLGSCPGLSWDAVAVHLARDRIHLPHPIREGQKCLNLHQTTSNPNVCPKIKIVLQPN